MVRGSQLIPGLFQWRAWAFEPTNIRPEGLDRIVFSEGAPARFSTERIEHDLAGDGRVRASPVPSARRKCANLPSIFDFSAERAEIADWLAERGGFEPPVPRELLPPQNMPRTGAIYAVPNYHQVSREDCRLLFGPILDRYSAHFRPPLHINA
jgi:hypothetical protein